MARPSKLTPAVQKTIVAYIRSGAFSWVAAEAAGIASKTFERWMKAGEQGDEEYHGFYEAVRVARGEARVTAEVEVRKGNPLAWLRYGPGRHRWPDEPGWTDSKDVTVKGDEDAPIPVVLQFGKGPAKKPEDMTDKELRKAEELLDDDGDGD
jgi:hypothetical protein